jgi:tetratricopeptide (TPR) repeat protein
MPNPHPHFEKMNAEMWDYFSQRDFENAARIAANIIQDSLALDAIHVAGLSLTALDRMEEGYDWCCASLSLASAKADWFNNAACQFMDKRDFLHAMVFVENGIHEHPDDLRLRYMRGLVYCNTQQWQKAIDHLDEVIEMDPEFYHAYMSKGFCLHMLARYDEAIATYGLGIPRATGGDLEEMVNNVACCLLEQAKPYEALDLLNQDYEKSTRAGTIYNKSFLYLGMGRWPEAWHMYRNRLQVQVNGDQGVPIVQQPIAQTLKDIRGADLFLFHEQGLGDCLQFVRFAKLLYPYVNSMVIGVPKTMHRMVELMDIGGPFTVLSGGENDDEVLKGCDIALPMLDSCAIFDLTPDRIPGEVPYFTIPEEVISKHQLPDTCKPRIGLCWAGASRPDNIRAHSIDSRRSIPFEMLQPILDLHDVFDFVSLQMPNHRPYHDHLIQPIQEEFDVMDTMAIVEQLDLVITIDSAVAHMAGSLGKPVWMLSRYDGCWRWFWDGRTDTAWYPTMRIYRQKAHHTWPEVLDRVYEDLNQLIEDRKLDTWTFQEARQE